jgi:glycosyltransferase involved in cell wall biosynthesis
MYSIIIPTRNRIKLLLKLLNELDIDDINLQEIIIVDSSDKKIELNIIRQFKKINYIHTDIKSAAIQRNIGLSYLDNNLEFIAFLDDDVLPPKDYFKELTNTLASKNAIGVSGLAQNLTSSEQRKQNLLILLIKKIFLLDSSKSGVVLRSGVNIPIKVKLGHDQIIQSEWLIGCALWDYQKIKKLKFNDNLYGQSLGEDVLFSLSANKLGTLYVNTAIILNHLESPIERPNNFKFYNMWIKNRYLIAKSVSNSKNHSSFHWCNIGKIIILLITLIASPAKNFMSLSGIVSGYFDLIRHNEN